MREEKQNCVRFDKKKKKTVCDLKKKIKTLREKRMKKKN
jgi:hypothetical protein